MDSKEETKDEKIEVEEDDTETSGSTSSVVSPPPSSGSSSPNGSGFQDPEKEKDHTYDNIVYAKGPEEYNSQNSDINELFGYEHHFQNDTINTPLRGQIQIDNKNQNTLLAATENLKIEEHNRKLREADEKQRREKENLNLNNNFSKTEALLRKHRSVSKELHKDDKKELAKAIHSNQNINDEKKLATEFLGKKIEKQRKEVAKYGLGLKKEPDKKKKDIKEMSSESEKLEIIEEAVKKNKIPPNKAEEINKLRGVNKKDKKLDPKEKKAKDEYEKQKQENKKLNEKSR